MSFVDDRPDVSVQALQALNDDFLYFNVAGSGPTFPIAQRAAEAYRTWMNGVGMFSHVGYDSYNAELSAARADLAAFIGDPDGASRIALTQSATDGLNTRRCCRCTGARIAATACASCRSTTMSAS